MESEIPQLKAQIDQRLAEAIAPHTWLLDATDGRPVDVSEMDSAVVLGGLAALLAALVDSVNLLATEMDRQNASR
jgi:hypothetical protein